MDQPGRPPRFEATNPDGTPLSRPYRSNEVGVTNSVMNIPDQARVQATVNRLNEGMVGLYNVYKATGSTDPNVDILSTMNKYGFSREQQQGGFFSKMWNSIVGSQQDSLDAISKRNEPESKCNNGCRY